MGVTVYQLFLIVEHSLLVILLDTATAGRIIARGSQSDGATVGQNKFLLHQSLAKGPATDNQTTVVILHRTGKNLTGAGAEFVDEYSDLGILERTVAVAPHLSVVMLVASLRKDDGLSRRQELIRHENCDFHKSAAIATQVNNVTLGTLFLQARHGGDEFIVGVASELVDLDKTSVLVNHIRGIDGIDRDVATGYRVGEHFGGGLAFDAQFHLGALLATQALDDLTVGHLWTCSDRIVDHDNLVSGHQSHFLARTAGNDLYHADGVTLQHE